MPKFLVDGVETDHIEGVGQKVELAPDTQKAITDYLTEQSKNPAFAEFLNGADERRLNAMMEGDSEISPGQKILAEVKSQRGTMIVKRAYEGRDWFIKRLPWPQLTEMALELSRDGSGQLNLKDDGVLTDLTETMMQCFLAVSETDESPLFTRAQAIEFVSVADPVEVAFLWNQINDLNPVLLMGADSKKNSGPSSNDSTN